MICDECETVAHCLKNGCVPKQPSNPVPLTDELSNAVKMACQCSYMDHGRRTVNEQAWQRLMQAVAACAHGIKGAA